MYFWKDIMTEKITIIVNTEKHSRHYGSLWTQTYFRLSTKPEFLVAKDEILATLATVPVATSSLFNKLYNQILWMDNRCWWNVQTSCPIKMWNWPDIFKIWSDNVRWPTVISSPASFKNTASIFPEILFIQYFTILSCKQYDVITDLICIIEKRQYL